MNNRHNLGNHDQQTLDLIEEILHTQPGSGARDPLTTVAAMLATTTPQADDAFRQALRERVTTSGQRHHGATSPVAAHRRSWWARIRRLRQAAPRLGMPRWVSTLAAVLLCAAIAAGTVVTAATWLRVERPEEPSGEVALFPPILPPRDEVQYRLLDPATAAQESGLAVAYLRQPPPGLAERVEVNVLPQSAWSATDDVAIAVRSMVRYRGSGHTVLVVLDEPSPGMAQKELLALGDRTVRLADGREGWLSTHPNWPGGNALILVHHQYLVVLVSDLSGEQLQELASEVVVVPPSGAAADRGIPPDWPTPVPDDLVVPGADIAVTGEVQIGGSARQPTMDFSASLGNRGSGIAEDLQVAVEFPSSLADRALEAYKPIVFGDTDLVHTPVLVGRSPSTSRVWTQLLYKPRSRRALRFMSPGWRMGNQSSARSTFRRHWAAWWYHYAARTEHAQFSCVWVHWAGCRHHHHEQRHHGQRNVAGHSWPQAPPGARRARSVGRYTACG